MMSDDPPEGRITGRSRPRNATSLGTTFYGLHESVDWWVDDQAARRLGVTLDKIHALIRAGELMGEQAERTHLGGGDCRPIVWWVRADSLLAYMRRGDLRFASRKGTTGNPGSGMPYAWLDCLTPEQRRELDRRRARFAALQNPDFAI